MRPIKFRAYHFPTKEMFQPSMEFVKVREGAYGVWYPRYGEKHGDVSEPMQFTGLLDKNGKEIYEGDIVLASTENTKYKWVVSYDEYLAAFTLERPTKGDESITFVTLDKVNNIHDSKKGLEVIGNIYENPELFK